MDAPVITRRPSALPMHHISRFSRSSVKCGTGASGGVYLGRDDVTGTIVAVKRRYERRSSGGAQGRQQQRDVDYTTTDDEGEDGLRVTASPNASVLRNTMRRSTVVVDEEALREAIGPEDETEDRIHALLYPHENIVDTLAVCSTSRHLVMPLMDADLRREIEGGNHELMNEDVSVWLLYDILVGIEHMHSHRVAHRDLKPQNVLLAKDEHRFPLGVRTVLCDFGSAHYATDTFIRDQSINQRGTLYYMPPEALLAKISAASQALPCDMWSFGCIVGELLTGTLLFPGSSQMNVLDNIVRRLGSTMGDWPRVVRHETLYDDLHDQISPHALDLLRGCLTLDAAQRITSQQALQHPFFATVASYYTQHQGGRLPAHGPPMSVYGLAPLLGLCSTKPLPNLSSITFVVIERGEDAGLAETSHNNTSNMNSTDNSIHLSALCRRDQLGAVSTIARSAGRWLDCSGEVTASNQRLFQRSLFSPSDAETSGYGPLNSMSTNHSQHGGAHVRSDDACKTLAFDSPGRTEHHYA